MFPCRQCQTGVVRLAEETEVLLHPLVVQEGSPVLWVGTTGAGADRGEDDKVCLDTWWEGESTSLLTNNLIYTTMSIHTATHPQIPLPCSHIHLLYLCMCTTLHCTHTSTCTNGHHL